jgi:uncharacterized membrane-anchored protein
MRPSPAASSLLSKVPEVSAVFWIAKVLTTGMGETASDYLVHVFPPVGAVALAGLAFVAALAAQFAARRYRPWVYWLAVVMVSVFGTMAADVLHVGLGVPYVVSTVGFSAALALVFASWYLAEKTLAIHSIRTRRREAFYWGAVLATFALGTAAGDMSAVTLHLGYFESGLVFAVLIAIPALAWRFGGLNGVFAFWFAYVVTRPLGASFADWLAVSHARGGLALGSGPVTLAAVLGVIGLVSYLSATHEDVEPEVAEA